MSLVWIFILAFYHTIIIICLHFATFYQLLHKVLNQYFCKVKQNPGRLMQATVRDDQLFTCILLGTSGYHLHESSKSVLSFSQDCILAVV